MADNNTMDYQTMLADMEQKKAVLEQAIASLRAALAIGALGATTGDVSGLTAVVSPASGGFGGGDIPQGAFLGKSITESIVLFLAALRRKCTGSEITQGLKKGGIESTSKTFDIVVRNTLSRLKSEGKLLRFDDGWALAEWYPEGFRARVDQKNKAKVKGHGAKKAKAKQSKAKVVSQKPTKPVEAARPKARIENYFSTHQGAEISPKELASALDLNASAVLLITGQMARQGRLEKTASGKLIRSSKITPISKAG